MPVLDVSAALQAAVAAAAEIARVGLSDSLAFRVAAPAAAAENTSSHAVSSPPALEPVAVSNTQSPVVQPVAPAPVVVAPYPQPTLATATVVAPRPSVVVDLSPASSSDQCTGQDAAGDQQELLLLQQPNDSGDAASGEKTFEESEEDAAKRLARSRERNREHARRTRLRKKAQLEALQSKVRGLEAEKKALKQKIEECSIASILINLADTPEPQENETTSLLDATIQRQTNDTTEAAKIHLLTAGKRKRFASIDTSEENKAPQTLKLNIDGQTRLIGPKSHINWKSGVYSDENGVQRQLTSEQLEGLRRERNRMHAKMTRDRKKNFIATIEKTIEELERDCQKMRDVLNKVGAHQQVLAAPVTPLASPRGAFILKQEQPAAPPVPVVAPTPTSCLLSAAAAMAPPKPQQPVVAIPESNPMPPLKRSKVAHGFSWNG